ncbi:BZ3500_MvSof-1268-A1-R1_Chr8-1g09815 [Microbotryum saponariae]|uniref:BZ3500_MvSof-1268-A1-R1_Chr8-1g09815 protein n=1 Tax=Microbotryum saponariae TaxID=289078 RepID=A0A2X0LLS4_9BASI|nr:BZ3500_MvSof-1268-A1-R1_Chr8-1g09815 [Microbotryum saponariae]SDA08101.1 BZ3501_MvSof-1269-A2-R1_Chr8-1g09538 [Microbotryum saponariae]
MAVDAFNLLPRHGHDTPYQAAHRSDYEADLADDVTHRDRLPVPLGEESDETEWTKIDYARLSAQLKRVYSLNRFRPANVFGCFVVFIALCFGLGALVGAIAGTVYYRSIVARVPTYSAKAAGKSTPIDQRVVSMFGPASTGGLDRFDLGVMLWHRKGVREPQPRRIMGYIGRLDEDERPPLWLFDDMSRAFGELGYARQANSTVPLNVWKPIFQRRVMKDASIAMTHATTVPITIPASVATDLAKNLYSELVATFVMLSPSANAASLKATADSMFQTSRPEENYGSNHSWPLSWINPDDPEMRPLDLFYAHTGAGYSLKQLNWDMWSQNPSAEHSGPPPVKLELSTSTMLTMANDFTTYELEGFRKAMRQLTEFKAECLAQEWWRPDCARAFKRDGHFENMIKLDSSKDTPWRYGPFMTTRFSAMSPKDHKVTLPLLDAKSKDVAQDFKFDWRVGWSPLSPSKMAIAALALPEWSTKATDPFGYKPHEQDYLEVFRKLLSGFKFVHALRWVAEEGIRCPDNFVGHNFNPRAHPIARTAVGFLAVLLQYLTIPLILHYWFVRSHAGGTSMAMFVLSYGNLAWMIIQTVYEWWESSLVWFIVKIVVHALLLFKQLTLVAHIEVRFEKFIPTAVRIRKPTHLERETTRVDNELSWILKVMVSNPTKSAVRVSNLTDPLLIQSMCAQLFAVCFSFLHFGDRLPRVVESPLYEMIKDLPAWSRREKGITQALLIGGSVQSSLWFLACICQIRLNHKLRTYGAEYRTTAFLSAAAMILSRLSSLFIGWFGPAAATSHFTLWDIISIFVICFLAVQASAFPGVPGKRS